MSFLPETTLLQSFVTVVEDLSFRRGAERLGIDQSALSRRIGKLERQLGYPLLERTTREVRLTPAGLAFYRRSVALLSDYSRSIEEARRIADGRTGTLRIAYMAFAATKLLPEAVVRFRARHPNVTLTLRYMSTQAQKVALANDEIDAAFMIGPFDNAAYRSEALLREPLHAVMARDHPLAARSVVTLAEVAACDLVLGDLSEWGEYRHRLAEMFNLVGASPRPVLEAPTSLAITGFVAAGLGVTIYPQSVLDRLGEGVEARSIVEPGLVTETRLVRKRANRPRPLLTFADLARQAGASLQAGYAPSV